MLMDQETVQIDNHCKVPSVTIKVNRCHLPKQQVGCHQEVWRVGSSEINRSMKSKKHSYMIYCKRVIPRTQKTNRLERYGIYHIMEWHTQLSQEMYQKISYKISYIYSVIRFFNNCSYMQSTLPIKRFNRQNHSALQHPKYFILLLLIMVKWTILTKLPLCYLELLVDLKCIKFYNSFKLNFKRS